MNRLLLTAIATSVGATIGLPALAQETTHGAALEEIVVTAQRREETLQSAPIALSVLSDADLERSGITSPNQLMTAVPALQVLSAGASTNFYIRGVGATVTNSYTDPGVAFNYDGVYIGRPSSTQGLMYDLQRIELLKGPQGTLYGRNTTGGAVNVLPRQPTLGEFNGYLTAEAGNYSLKRGQGAVNIPVGENSAFRLSGQVISRDGYLDDGLEDDKGQSGRIQFLTRPSDDLSIRIAGDYYHRGGNGFGATLTSKADPVLGPNPQNPSGPPVIAGYAFSDTGISNRAGLYNAASAALWSSRVFPYALSLDPTQSPGIAFTPIFAYKERNDNKFWGVNAEINWNTALGTLTVVPAYRHAHLDFINHAGGFGAASDETSKQKSFEARLASDSSKPLSYIAGAYYYEENIDAQYAFNGQQFLAYQPLETGVESAAAFSRLTWAVTPDVRLNGGVRYTRDRRFIHGTGYVFPAVCVVPEVSGVCPGGTTAPDGFPNEVGLSGPPFVPGLTPINGSTALLSGAPFTVLNRTLTDEAVTWRVGTEWNVTDNSMTYASFETGFRSGGFFFTSDNPTFKPERIQALTLGSKNRFLDNRLQVNAEIFYWKYKDQQVSHLSSDSTGQVVFIVENVGQSVNKGAELDTRFLLTEKTLLSADLQYLKARYDDFKYSAPNIGVPPVVGCPAALSPTGTSYEINCSNRTPQKAPEWTLNLGIQQTFTLGGAGSLIASADTRYQTKTLIGVDFTPNEVVKAYWMSNAALTYQTSDERWSVTAFINNIEDKDVPVTMGNNTALNLYATEFLPPRTYGARVTAKF